MRQLRWLLSDYGVCSVYSVGMLDNETVHVPAGMERDSVTFYLGTQNHAQSNTYELYISGILYSIFSDHASPWVTETMESKP